MAVTSKLAQLFGMAPKSGGGKRKTKKVGAGYKKKGMKKGMKKSMKKGMKKSMKKGGKSEL